MTEGESVAELQRLRLENLILKIKSIALERDLISAKMDNLRARAALLDAAQKSAVLDIRAITKIQGEFTLDLESLKIKPLQHSDQESLNVKQ